ncbi:MAG: hypothetical protein DRG83_04545 [Deltaproteobacteria bacterium]|nr:MAG: hypothetical protein DRG83_04545 [Deltaproteobacteria bacterium]
MRIEADSLQLKEMYEKERQAKMRQAVSIGSIIGCLLVPLFGILDYLVARPFLNTLLAIRFVCSLGLFIIYFLNRSKLGEKYSSYFAIYGVASVGIAIALMTYFLGGPESRYYAGINLAVIVGGLLMPMTILEGIITFTIIYASFIAVSYPYLHGQALLAFYCDTFFLIATMVIVLVGFRFKEKVALQEIQSRLRLMEAQKQLEKHTENLEKAVRQRTASLVHSERMAAVGQLAAGISHEFNNILTVIIAHGELAKLDNTKESLAKAVEIAIESAKRASEIARNLLTFSRQSSHERHYINLQKCCESALSLMESSFKKANIEIKKNFPPHLPPVWASETELQQVLVNIIINAFHAMGEGGVLEIGAKEIDGEVALSISDTGCGIPRENLEKIFEPFFTTKGVWGDSDVPGSGLGLSVVHGIVSSLGGRIAVESTVNEGTCFTIFIPIPPEGLEKVTYLADSTVPTHFDHAAKSLKILVVDDEREIAEGITKLLRARGHEVTSANNSSEALEKLEQERYDLVITDLLMPGLSGEHILARCQRFNPPIPCMVITGAAKPGLTEELLGLGAFACLHKPFTIIDLVNIILRFEKNFQHGNP